MHNCIYINIITTFDYSQTYVYILKLSITDNYWFEVIMYLVLEELISGILHDLMQMCKIQYNVLAIKNDLMFLKSFLFDMSQSNVINLTAVTKNIHNDSCQLYAKKFNFRSTNL